MNEAKGKAGLMLAMSMSIGGMPVIPQRKQIYYPPEMTEYNAHIISASREKMRQKHARRAEQIHRAREGQNK